MKVVKFDSELPTIAPNGRQPAIKRSLRYSPEQPRDDHGRFGEGGVTYDVSEPIPHEIGTQAMFALVRVGDKLITKTGTKYTVKSKSETTLHVYDHAANVIKDVSKTEVDKELTYGSRSSA